MVQKHIKIPAIPSVEYKNVKPVSACTSLPPPIIRRVGRRTSTLLLLSHNIHMKFRENYLFQVVHYHLKYSQFRKVCQLRLSGRIKWLSSHRVRFLESPATMTTRKTFTAKARTSFFLSMEPSSNLTGCLNYRLFLVRLSTYSLYSFSKR
jgi:hypothetical protein